MVYEYSKAIVFTRCTILSFRIDGDYNDVEWTETKIYNLTQEKKAGISALKKNQKTQQQQQQEEGTSK